jgi:hypothetical protein
MLRLSSIIVRALLALAVAGSSASAAGADAKLEEAMAHGGLQKISVKGIDLVYARPGAKLSAYDKVIVDPVKVSFSGAWNPKRTGSSLPLSEQEREAIRSGVAKLVHEEFVRELGSKSGYQVVTSPGPGVLRVKPDIVNLYVTAPDTGGAARSRTYVASAGQMTLVAELSDSSSGEVQARVVDRREAQRFTGMKLSSGVENEGEARAIASGWAKAFRAAMDRAHGIGGK